LSEAKLILDLPHNENKLLYIANILLSLSGVEQLSGTGRGEDRGLYYNGKKVAAIGELQNLFEILSLKKEFNAEKDIHGRASEEGKDFTASPIVNKTAEKIKTPLQESFKVIFTHDIDWITGIEPVSMVKAARHVLNKNSEKWLSVSQALAPSVFEEGIKKILEVEKNFGISSWFFFLSGPYGTGRYSSRYDSTWKSARKIISLVKESGCEVGLHGSYYAADYNSYKDEAKRLGEAAGINITAHRNHYLRFKPQSIAESLEQAGIRYDFSAGYNKGMGFRAGITSVYPLYNHLKDKPSSVREVPLIFMERNSHLEDEEAALRGFSSLLQEVKKYNGCVSVLFHPENFVVENRWYEFYNRFIETALEAGADISGRL
jgi:hypothetical protein